MTRALLLDHNSPRDARVITMPAPRGHKQSGRSGNFPADKAVRATVMLDPGDYVRTLYEELVKDMDVSGAEVLREASGSCTSASPAARRR